MNRSESINELATALAKAQGELRNPAFDSTNPHFRSKYASLAAVRNAVMPVLSKHGLSIVQPLSTTEAGIVCETVLMHSSGQWISESLAIPAVKRDPQGLVSASTYARRAGLQSIVCVVGDDDDDGNEATASAPAKVAAKPPKPAKRETVDADTGEIKASGPLPDHDLGDVLPTAEERLAYAAHLGDQFSALKTVEEVKALFGGLWKDLPKGGWKRTVLKAAYDGRMSWFEDETNLIEGA